MAIAVVAHTADALGSSGPTTTPINTTGATQIYIAVAAFASIDGSALSDSKGNTWTALHGGQAANGAGPNVRFFYCDAPVVGSGHTVSYIQGSSYAAVAVVAVSGASGTPDVNVSAAGAQYGSALTPAHDNEIVITAAYVGGTHGTIDGGFTISDSVDLSGGNHIGVQFAYLIQTTATAFQPTWSAAAPIVQASFQASGGGSGNASVTGVRATATATGKTGSPKVSPSRARATMTAAGKAGTPRVCVTGVRALVTATGKSGSVSVGGSLFLSGTRATATAAGRAGTPKCVLPGTRATATAAGRAGCARIRLSGPRALATATGHAGTVSITNGGNVATPRLTSRTRVRLITL